MITLIGGLPDNVVAIEAVGRVSAADYSDVLEPAVEAALRGHDKLRLLYVLGERFEGYSAGAMWEDTKLGVGHWQAWERIAIVTDRGWIGDAVRAMAWILPGRVKVFAHDDSLAAADWAVAD
jgi:hypothetical protein